MRTNILKIVVLNRNDCRPPSPAHRPRQPRKSLGNKAVNITGKNNFTAPVAGATVSETINANFVASCARLALKNWHQDLTQERGLAWQAGWPAAETTGMNVVCARIKSYADSEEAGSKPASSGFFYRNSKTSKISGIGIPINQSKIGIATSPLC